MDPRCEVSFEFASKTQQNKTPEDCSVQTLERMSPVVRWGTSDIVP